jgi:DNA-binding LytR/AlgR family response regulator
MSELKALIIEDEVLAQEYLVNLLNDSAYELHVVGICSSLKSALRWFIRNEEPDLIFMDIDLGDGLCFEIFDVINITCPIIFTTAFDEYAIQAFKVNSIDYLLKPISSRELLRALNKYSQFSSKTYVHNNVDQIAKIFLEKFKSRFIIKIGQHIKSLPTEDIHFFRSKEKATYAINKDGRSYLIEYSLDRLESIMNPADFFRINRKYIINFQSISDIISYSGSRLKLTLKYDKNNDIIVSRERVGDFKAWLDR